MDDASLLVDLHARNARLGPGSDAHTRLAWTLAGLRDRAGLRIADLGCGTGASTLVLADAKDASVTAVDRFPAFLETLRQRALGRGVGGRIETMATSFEALPFEPGSLDVIWSEGAIYNLGFERGVRVWRPFLAAGGVLAVSEITWLTAERPAVIEDYWQTHYPEIDVASAKLAILERNGFSPLGYFTLPESCWIDEYYEPLRSRFRSFLAEHGGSDEARALVAAEEAEIALYERYKAYFSYGFYVARRVDG